MPKTNIKVEKKVFKPTGTSELLLEACLKQIKKTDEILDLGCGSGIVGISVAKTKRLKKKIYFSDISKFATKNTKQNCTFNKIKHEIKTGSVLKPWDNFKFNVIISDVASISDSIAKISPWYNKSITNKAGKDGIKNIIEIIKGSKEHLKKDGKLIFPIISLSNEEKILSYAKKNVIFMHCLPVGRNEEVTDEVIDGRQSVVWTQALNRIHAQKSIINWCLN